MLGTQLLMMIVVYVVLPLVAVYFVVRAGVRAELEPLQDQLTRIEKRIARTIAAQSEIDT